MPNDSGNPNLILDILASLKSQPVWVLIWVMAWLLPVNIASLFFMSEPLGLWVAVLASLGYLLNLPILMKYRGFTPVMAVPHVLAWVPLIILILVMRPEGTGLYGAFLITLVITNIISLAFDIPDTIKVLRSS